MEAEFEVLYCISGNNKKNSKKSLCHTDESRQLLNMF